MGQVSDDRDFVYLTDGGHFDNMGLYELVRRRCSFVVITDVEQDAESSFEGIGMAIRKCRIDFGAEITLDLSPLIRDRDKGTTGAHWVRGTIRYPETSDREPGTVLYIKSSLTGDEPPDLQNYSRQHPDYPHDSTADQWFTESQFESYRRLGLHIVETCPGLAALPR